MHQGRDSGIGEIQADSGYISKVKFTRCGKHSDVGASENKGLEGLRV